jgi:hypothetical protein
MAEPGNPPPSVPERTPLDALAERFRVPPAWTGRVFHLLLLLAVSVGAAFVISPGLYGQQIPELKPADVGRPYRTNSPSGFKANRDYEIPNKAATELQRLEARASVRPVYDYNPAVLPELKRGIQDAFALMRELVVSYAAVPPKADEVEKPAARKRRLELEEELDARLREARRDFEQKLFGRPDSPVEDEDFQALLAERFSPAAEQASLLLLDRAYLAPVASSREELSREGGGGISVRDLRENSEQARPALAPTVLDVREAQGELDRFASVPGNLLIDKPAVLRRAVLRTIKRLVRPNLTINTAETDARRRRAAEAVKEVVTQIKKGQKVIGDGELITENHLIIFKGMREQIRELDLAQLQVGGAGLIAVVIAAVYVFQRAAFRRFRPSRKDALVLGLLLLATLGLMHVSMSVADAVHDRYDNIPVEAFYYAIPVAAGAMLVRFLMSEETALFFAVVLAVLSGMLFGNSLAFGIHALVGSLVAAERVARAKDRVGIFKAGMVTGAACLLAVLFSALAEGKGFTGDTLIVACFAFVGTSLAAPAMVMAVTPLMEFAFGYASDIKLLELANLNHPALKELIVQAPGTYHHSIILGTLVENAAEDIGANPLLARSCAYYHDIGKGRNPLYFGENQKGDNRHDQLAPAMSAVIIKRHVTEGLEMARQYRLPKRVADAIPQHHGTRLVGFFFHKAVKEQEGKENPQPIDESIYRYPGPKPQFREAALVMIADAVEASCRSMPEPTTQKLQAQVQKMINLIFAEGQLDECDLTLKDLNLIAQSFLHTLEGIYHARPVYPPGAVGGKPPEAAPKPAALAVAAGGKSDKRSAGG